MLLLTNFVVNKFVSIWQPHKRQIVTQSLSWYHMKLILQSMIKVTVVIYQMC